MHHLATWPFKKDFTVVGTLRSDERIFEKELKAIQSRDEKSQILLYH